MTFQVCAARRLAYAGCSATMWQVSRQRDMAVGVSDRLSRLVSMSAAISFHSVGSGVSAEFVSSAGGTLPSGSTRHTVACHCATCAWLSADRAMTVHSVAVSNPGMCCSRLSAVDAA